MKRAALIGSAVAMVAVLPGCRASGLAFFEDKRVEIVAPAENATTSLPIDVRWTAKGYDGYFGVLFDRSPMAPNRPLLSLVPDDDPCRQQDVCPTPEWLAERFIYVTDRTQLRVDTLPDSRNNDRSKDRHQVTIVLLDQDGRRVGESAFVNEFIVERD